MGVGLGFVVASQIGPMSMFLMRATLRSGWRIGLWVGGGIAVVDGLYASVGAAGVAPLLSIPPLRLVLGFAGAAVLLRLGTRTLYGALRVRIGAETDADVTRPSRAFLVAMAGTASNPLTIASWAAVFAAASTAGAARTTGEAVLLVAGAAIGSLASVSALASGVAILGRTFGDRIIRVAEAIADAGMIGFGAALAYGAARDR